MYRGIKTYFNTVATLQRYLSVYLHVILSVYLNPRYYIGINSSKNKTKYSCATLYIVILVFYGEEKLVHDYALHISAKEYLINVSKINKFEYFIKLLRIY